MSCSLERSRVLGDTLAKFTVQLTRDGTPVNLAGKEVRILAYDVDGNEVIAESSSNVVVSNASLGYVDYDFQTVDFVEAATAFALDPTLEAFDLYIFFRVYVSAGSEPDTWPDDDGILYHITNPALAHTTPDPSQITGIDIATLAKAPRRTRTVEGTVEERSVSDLIKADQYLTGKEAINAVPWGMRIAKTKPPSTLS